MGMDNHHYHQHHQSNYANGSTTGGIGGHGGSIPPFITNYYHPEKRLREVRSTWDNMKDKIKEQVDNQLRSPEEGKDKGKEDGASNDPCLVQINDLEKRTSQFQEDSKAFTGPCFTRLFRKLNSTGLQLQGQLDAVNIPNEELKKKRKNLAIEVEKILQELKRRAHPNGCDDCEVQFI